MKFLRALPVLFLIALLAGIAWMLRMPHDEKPLSRAWGNVETRQTSLAFEASGRISELLLEEGERAEAGAILGRLDTSALEIERRRTAAEVRRARAQAELAHEGTRAEDIDAARANEAHCRAEVLYAEATLRRQAELAPAGASSRQALDEARYALNAARESLAAASAKRTAAEAGLRPQEVESAEAQLEAAQAALDSLDYQIETASVLKAPSSGIIRARLAEPGDMAGPSRTVYQLSVIDPKWIRIYVTERQLGLLREGSRALVSADTVPPMEGTVAFISSTAEFTPKTVQTEALRSSLIYEARIIVRDPENRLRLGQPVTAELQP